MIRFFFFKRKKIREKRRFERKSTRCLVQLRGRFVPERPLNLVNISEGGIQVASPQWIEVNQTVLLALNFIRRNHQFQAVGSVLWGKVSGHSKSAVYRTGIVFTEIQPNDVLFIRNIQRQPLFKIFLTI